MISRFPIFTTGARDLLPVVVRFGGEIMLTLFVDNQSVDFPDDRRGRTKDMLHEGFHIDMGLERRCRGRIIGYRWRCRCDQARNNDRDDRDNSASNATDVDHLYWTRIVNPIQRPHITTETHSRMDSPPASRAGSGSNVSFSHRGKSLALIP